ncbi:MAG TPA: hypothetical protein VII58_02300, partial [Acidobacteriaceae bacterium]
EYQTDQSSLKTAPTAARSVLEKRRNQQQHTHRLRRFDTVTPYQANARFQIHRANLSTQDIGEHEGLPVTTVSRSIMDVLLATHRTDVARQSSDALREGLLNSAEASSLRRSITRTSSASSPSTNGSRVKVYEAATS